jgi:acyl dehydratase
MRKPVIARNEELEQLNKLVGSENEAHWGEKEELWGSFHRRGSDAEQNRLVDEYVAARNEQAGQIVVPQVGEWPPTLENFYGAQNNEWITTDLIRHYAEAVGDRNPVWRSEQYARKTIWGGIIAQPTILDMLANPSPFYWERDLRERPWKRFNSYGWAPAGRDYEWFQVMRPGDKIRLLQSFLGLQEVDSTHPKPTRVFMTTTRRWFINQREETVATEDIIWRMTINHPAGMVAPPARPLRRLTDAERDDIYRRYNDERRRGNDPFCWEDIAVGDESEPHVVGPISVYDQVSGYVARMGHAMAFAAQWDRIRLNFDFAWFDADVNAWKSAGEGHIVGGQGHAATHGGGRSFGLHQMEGVRCYAITNWMGDNAFLTKFTNRNRNVPLQGDVFKTTLRVTNKYSKDAEHFVELEVSTTDLDGLLFIDGTATVRLPSRIRK